MQRRPRRLTGLASEDEQQQHPMRHTKKRKRSAEDAPIVQLQKTATDGKASSQVEPCASTSPCPAPPPAGGLSPSPLRDALRVINDTLIAEYDFALSHDRSYEHLIRDALVPLIESARALEHTVDGWRHRVSWQNVRVGRPTFTLNGKTTMLLPHEATRRHVSMGAPVLVDIVHTRTPVELGPGLPPIAPLSEATTTIVPGFQIAHFPVMENGVNCHSRLLGLRRVMPGGGTFVSNGNRRIIPPLRNLMWNNEIVGRCFKPAQFSHKLEFRSCHEASKYNSTATMLLFLTKPNKKLPGHGPNVHIKLPRVVLPATFPVGIVFLALGWPLESILSIVQLGAGRGWFEGLRLRVRSMQVAARYALINAGLTVTRRDALQYIYNAMARAEHSHSKAAIAAAAAVAAAGGTSRAPPDHPADYAQKEALKHLDEQLLPHMNPEVVADDAGLQQNQRKGLFLGYLIWRLLSAAAGRQAPDDRDDHSYITYDSCGTLLAQLFRQILANFTKDAYYLFKYALENNKPIDWHKIFVQKKINKRLHECMNTGEWTAKRGANAPPRKDISQLLVQNNIKSAYSHLMKLANPLPPKARQDKARQVHKSQFGRVCPVETPESDRCGLVGAMCLGSRLSVGSCPFQIMHVLERHAEHLGLVPLQDYLHPPVPLGSCAKVFLNGDWVGWTSEPARVAELIMQLRRGGVIHREVSCFYDETNLRISTMRDRLLRLLFVATPENVERVVQLQRDGLLKFFTSQDLLRECIVELLDANEEQQAQDKCLIAFNADDYEARLRTSPTGSASPASPTSPTSPTIENTAGPARCTHIEVSPNFMLSLGANLIPGLEHNQGPRNTYFCAMGKQTCAPFPDGIQHSKTQHELVDVEVPLVQTKLARIREPMFHAEGLNPLIAIMPFYGQNQEDSLHISQAFIDRMAYTTLAARLYKDEQRRCASNGRSSTNNKTQFEKPNPETTVGMKLGDSSHIEADGQPRLRSNLGFGSYVYGKTIASKPSSSISKGRAAATGTGAAGDGSLPTTKRPSAKRAKFTKRDDSKQQNVDEPAQVTWREKITNGKEPVVLTVVTKSYRIPIVGDKMSSRHAQKATIGQVVPQADMPFILSSGLSPAILINQLCMPSRMTIAMLIEMLLGIYATVTGELQDQSAFERISLDEITETLHKAGMQRYGMQRMVNGKTGKLIEASVFVAPCYIVRLKHSPHDKIHARAYGPRQPLTRQPTEGRQRDGGLRLGEMERDCLIGHGASACVKERLCTDSDRFLAAVCQTCGLLTTYNSTFHWGRCTVCRSADGVRCVYLPYAAKLILQEALTLNIGLRLRTRDVIPNNMPANTLLLEPPKPVGTKSLKRKTHDKGDAAAPKRKRLIAESASASIPIPTSTRPRVELAKEANTKKRKTGPAAASQSIKKQRQ